MGHVVEVGLGQIHPRQGGRGCGAFHGQRHPAGPAALLGLQQLSRQGVPLVRRAGVADDEDAAPRVVTHDGLHVGRVDGGRGESEGDPAVDQSLTALPRDSELATQPAVARRPLPLQEVRRAVVADLVGNLQMLCRLIPVVRDCGESGRRAREVLLEHKGHGEEHLAGIFGRVRHVLRHLAMVLVV